jgi:hypothetical protein
MPKISFGQIVEIRFTPFWRKQKSENGLLVQNADFFICS